MSKLFRFLSIVAVCMAAGISPCWAQRGQPRQSPAAPAEPATFVGNVVAYEADKSITLEATTRQGATKREFAIVKETTRVELPPRIKEIRLGLTLGVWADKDDPKLAARISTANVPAMPATTRRPNNRTPAMPAAAMAANVPAAAPPVVTAARPVREPVPDLAAGRVAAQIDQHIDERLAAARIPTSPRSDDAEFIRRVYLDITGVIPPGDAVATFLDSREPDKRVKLIDELLASPQYGWHFADLWCDRINLKDMPIHREPFIQWLSETLNHGRGWNEVAYDLMTAEGKFKLLTRGKRLQSDDPRGLLMVLSTESKPFPKPSPASLAAETGRLFLGVQIQCAECHDHPFSPAWKQTDFWGLAAFFSQFLAGTDFPSYCWKENPLPPDSLARITIPAPSRKNIGKIVPARLLGAEDDFRSNEQLLLRQALASWVASPENPYFAQAAVNRLWSDFFGRGLVDPVDDLRPDNPPSHPTVLTLLTEEFKKSEFDLKHLIRCICLSETYQRTSVPLPENEEDRNEYSHMAVRIMGPGVFYDCLSKATGWPNLWVGLPQYKTKLTVSSKFTPREVFVDFFRSSQGQEADPLENSHGIPQALKLMNAPQLSSVAPVVVQWGSQDLTREQMLKQIYLTALARLPTGEEMDLMSSFLQRREDRDSLPGYSAVLWTLLNSAEFVSNH